MPGYLLMTDIHSQFYKHYTNRSILSKCPHTFSVQFDGYIAVGVLWHFNSFFFKPVMSKLPVVITVASGIPALFRKFRLFFEAGFLKLLALKYWRKGCSVLLPHTLLMRRV